MSQDQRQLLKNTKEIVIVLDGKESVSCKNGYFKCHLTPDTYHFVEHLLWQAILSHVAIKVKSSTLNAATCLSKRKKR